MRKRTGHGPVTWFQAAARYNSEVAKYHRDRKGTEFALRLITAFLDERLSRHIRMDEITHDVAMQMREWRRGQTLTQWRTGNNFKPSAKLVSDASVNRSVIEPLRKVFNHMKDMDHQFAREPKWKKLRLDEDRPPPRELSGSEETALFEHVRPDYLPWLTFALFTGLRLGETLIEWRNVNWEAGVITTIGKRGRIVRTPITPDIADLLEPLKGHHETAVFTYISRKPKAGQHKGTRYPLTYAGIKSEWKEHRARAAISGLKIHDLRHDLGSKANREGNLTTTSRALNHSDTGVTSKHYVNTSDADVAALLQRVSQSRVGVPKKVPKTAGTETAKLLPDIKKIAS